MTQTINPTIKITLFMLAVIFAYVAGQSDLSNSFEDCKNFRQFTSNLCTFMPK